MEEILPIADEHQINDEKFNPPWDPPSSDGRRHDEENEAASRNATPWRTPPRCATKWIAPVEGSRIDRQSSPETEPIIDRRRGSTRPRRNDRKKLRRRE